MARGWESKSVESQQADREADRARSASVSPEQARRNDTRRTLELTRARAQADLSRATAPAHRAMLEEALRTLDEQLAALAREP
jgi:hypothetical protein